MARGSAPVLGMVLGMVLVLVLVSALVLVLVLVSIRLWTKKIEFYFFKKK